MFRTLLLVLLITVPASAKMRTWTDSTGKYTVKAEFVSADKETVTLQTDAGKTKSIPLARLSLNEQAYIRRMLDSLKRGADKPKQNEVATATAEVPAGGEVKTAGSSDNEVVYVTTTGSYYHKKSCDHVNSQSVQMTLSEALEEKYKPCIECHPELRPKIAKDDKPKGEPKPRKSYNRQPADSSGFLGGGVSSGGNGGSVHVNGYTRSNGTYVAPYTRSAPRR
jgi:uncharacterized membrane protein YgcG